MTSKKSGSGTQKANSAWMVPVTKSSSEPPVAPPAQTGPDTSVDATLRQLGIPISPEARQAMLYGADPVPEDEPDART